MSFALLPLTLLSSSSTVHALHKLALVRSFSLVRPHRKSFNPYSHSLNGEAERSDLGLRVFLQGTRLV